MSILCSGSSFCMAVAVVSIRSCNSLVVEWVKLVGDGVVVAVWEQT